MLLRIREQEVTMEIDMISACEPAPHKELERTDGILGGALGPVLRDRCLDPCTCGVCDISWPHHRHHSVGL